MATTKKKTTKSKSKVKVQRIVMPKSVETLVVPVPTIIPDVVIDVKESPETSIVPPKQNKTEKMVKLLTRENGATLTELAKDAGWLPNSVRGALSVYAKKHSEYTLTSEKVEGIRTYHLKLKLFV